ncbi:MAG: peptide chain release factor N(5)-glutamine methyltransferase [Clostridia bacterium]|nr:peptide chain release factor N(5)-glutamine methyltransferase [Clostridia bacterium]
MNILDAISKGIKLLSESLSDINPRFESELLLSYAIKKERIWLLLHGSDKLSEDDCNRFLGLVKRRADGEPFSYITGTKEFMSLDFKVKEGVLIPRPDTETLVSHIIETFKNKNALILDLCTGSGAIAVSIAKYLEDSFITAVDISDVCIETAKENAETNGVADRVDIVKKDILTGFSTDKQFDCIVSNPPYIKTEDIKTLMKDVKDFEPTLALDGGNDGLIFYRKISTLAKKLLKKDGMLAFEIGHNQAEDVYDIMKNEGFSEIDFVKDLAGINRVIYGKYIL